MNSVDYKVGGTGKTPTGEFVVPRHAAVSYADKILPAGWTQRQAPRQLEQSVLPEFLGTRILQADSTGVLRGRLVAMLDSAVDTICVSSFLLADKEIVDALLRASERGVRVYVLTASEVQLQREPRTDNEFDYARLKEHVQMLQRLAGHVLVRTGESFHSKFILVNPRLQEAKGFLLTANLTEEALTRNVELGIQLHANEAQDLFRQFLTGFWMESSNELLDPSGLTKVQPWLNAVALSPVEIPCTMRGAQTLAAAIDSIVERAKTEVILASFGMDAGDGAVEKIVRAAKAGKRVRVLARPRPNSNTMNALLALAEAGAEVRGHPWLHAKCLLADTDEGWSALVMTANFENKGLRVGFESGVLMDGEDAEGLRRLVERWWNEFPLALFTAKRVEEILGRASVWKDGALTEVHVREEGDQDIGDYEASSFDEIESFVPPSVKDPQISGLILYHKKTFRYRVLAPRLPAGASRVPREGELKVYRRDSRMFVAIDRLDQLTMAKALGKQLGAKVVAQY